MNKKRHHATTGLLINREKQKQIAMIAQKYENVAPKWPKAFQVNVENELKFGKFKR